MPVRVLVRQIEADVGAVDAAAAHALAVDGDVAHTEITNEPAQPVRIEPQVDEGRDRHVAGDACKRIEDQGLHCVLRCSMTLLASFSEKPGSFARSCTVASLSARTLPNFSSRRRWRF